MNYLIRTGLLVTLAMPAMILPVSAQELVPPSSPAVPAENPAPPLPPSCAGAPYTDFDFWLGEWSVYDEAGTTLQGHNSITSAEDGCLLIERWTGAGGSTGQSYNFYDPTTGQWRQVWVARGAVIDYTGGLNEAGQMVLEGTIAYRSNGRVADFRGTWTERPDGAVIQFFEEKNAETGEWAEWFTGLYVPEGMTQTLTETPAE